MLQHPESQEVWHHCKVWPHCQIPTSAPYVRIKYKWFTSDMPHFSFKKLILSTLRLLPTLHTMFLVKAVPDGLKDCECKKIALCKRPPIFYVPEKDCVQETVSAFKNNHLKMQFGKGTKLWVPIWYSGMGETFLIYVGFVAPIINDFWLLIIGAVNYLKKLLSIIDTWGN